MATKKEAPEKAAEKVVKPVQAEELDGGAPVAPVEGSGEGAGGTVSTEPQPRHEPDQPEVLIVPEGDKPPTEQPTLEEAPPDPDQIVLFRNDTNAPVLLGETYLFPQNSRKARRRDGAGKGLTEL